MGAAAKSSPDSVPPSPAGSNMAAPPSRPTPSRQRKKPGPKPKAKAPQTLVVKLKAKPEFLANLKSSSDGTSPQTGAGTPNGSSPGATSPQPSAEASEANLVPGAAGQKRKGIPGPKPGVKRVRQPGAPPLKPGRKKTKLDPSLPPGVLLNGVVHGGAKLGPKANTGAINDKLRALDRTGKPCKRWARAGFTLKSFTGVQWAVPTWSAPKQLDFANPDMAASTTANSENVSVSEMSPSDDKMQTDISAPALVIPTLALPPGITV